ncbi:lipase 3 [Folsomia candida]|uniref:Lipase n=1 Tax=Folsomia candida TaxID=158441 RepID=A0A226EUL0_FOLCA|nr:lipase 3 [Folsomia candida]OXA60491.1 Lipase 3 [Folsomia candida]
MDICKVLSLLLVGTWASLVSGDLTECDALTMICGNLVQEAFTTYPNYADLKTPQLIQRLGYPVEEHNVTTADHYILTMYRIPYSNSSPPALGKIPVLLVHGVLASSVQWLWQPPDRSLAFMLADSGFDVWLGNSRGTSYSRGHTFLPSNDPNNLTYWDFSFHEMGLYDLPATVNYINSLTSQRIYYVGHSLGTTQFFSGISLNPGLASKIRAMFSLATSGYINHMTNAFFRASAPFLVISATEQTINQLGGGQFLPQVMQQYIGDFTTYCTQYTLNCGVCNTVFGVLFGIDMCQTDFRELPGILAHLPDTTSTKTFAHIAQDATLGTFRQYDYGLNNFAEYGSLLPPNYDWSKYHVPTVIYYGDNDNLAVPIDVLATANALRPNVVQLSRVNYSTWDHMDFVIGKDADVYLYNDMLNIMRNHTYG